MTPDDAPAFLTDTLSRVGYRRAGEWDLSVPETPADPKQENVIQRLVVSFIEAFPWVTFERLELGTEESSVEPSWDNSGRFDVKNWLLARVEKLEDCYGFEASVDLWLHWQNPDGEAGRSKMPRAATLLFDRVDAMCTFTIWPNFFTDQIDLLSRRSAGGFDARRVPFANAACLNRHQLASSLRTWESVTAGEIVSWGSELVDGVDRYGFPESALPL